METIEEYYCKHCGYLGDAYGTLQTDAQTLWIDCPSCESITAHDPADYGHFLMAIDENVCSWPVKL